MPFGHLWTIALSFSAAWFDSIPVSSFSNLEDSTQILHQDFFIAIKSKPSLKNFKFCSTFYPRASYTPSFINYKVHMVSNISSYKLARCICIIFSTITRVCGYNFNLKLKCFGCLDLFNCLLVLCYIVTQLLQLSIILI